jgi:hypothetical protein
MTVREKMEELRRNRPILNETERSKRKQVEKRRHAAKELTDAIETLATGTGDVRSRLLTASVAILLTQRDDFPESKRAIWDQVIKTVSRFEPYFETRSGAFLNTPKNATRGMKNITAQRAAKQIWDLYWSVSKNSQYR